MDREEAQFRQSAYGRAGRHYDGATNEAGQRGRLDERLAQTVKAEAAARSVNQVGPSSILEHIDAHIRDAAFRSNRQADRLNDHAMALHGPWPVDPETANDRDRPAGVLARIMESLDRLSMAQTLLDEAIDRNVNIA